MIKLLGVLIASVGFILAIYVGAWVMFVGGILGIVSFFKENLSYSFLAISILKILFAGFTASVIGYVSVLIGALLYNK